MNPIPQEFQHCGICQEPFAGDYAQQSDPFAQYRQLDDVNICTHLFHARCLKIRLKEQFDIREQRPLDRQISRLCPECNKKVPKFPRAFPQRPRDKQVWLREFRR